MRTLQIGVPPTGSLGLSLQWTPLSIVSNIWHVLDVPANSPADQACLFPFSDWIVGTPEGTLHGEGGLGELVEDHLGRPLRLWVYNNEYDVTREVTLTPSRDWGGEGAVGCVLGYGALHRLPAPLSEPINAPGETMFDGVEHSEAAPNMFVSGSTSGTPFNTGGMLPPPQPPTAGAVQGEFLVPAQVAAPGIVSTPSPARSHGKQRKKHHVHAGPNMMDDYLREEEQKSKELDGVTMTSKSKVLPPPPKGGKTLKAASKPAESPVDATEDV